MGYFEASEDLVAKVEQIAQNHHQRLDGARIAVLFQEEATKSGGRLVLATATKPSEKMMPLLKKQFDFIICIAFDQWELMDDGQREALIDHELSHCAFDKDGKAQLVGHDLEEFAGVIKRHGYWRRDDGEVMFQQSLLGLGISVEAAPVGKE